MRAGRALTKAKNQAVDGVGSLWKRTARDTKNTVRLFTEGRCDREGRKKGPAAKRKCLNDRAHQGSSPPPAGQQVFLALAELDCFKPGRSERWGTSLVTGSSFVSREEAERDAIDQIRRYRGLCRKRWNDENMYDGKYRWVDR